MGNALIEAARKRKKEQERKDAVQQDRDKQVQEAFAEIEERERVVSFPDYYANGGKDSHAAIQEDKTALQALIDEQDGEPDMLPREPAKGTDELLAEIRNSLDGSNS